MVLSDPPRAPSERAPGWRGRVDEVIFGVDTPAGKAFDVLLLWSILLSVVAVVLESVPEVSRACGRELKVLEWGFTILFTVEYALRVVTVPKPRRYITSFFGVVDLLAVLPTYASILVAGSESLIVIRALRLLRIFRVFKLIRHSSEARQLMRALAAAREKVTVFMGFVVTLVVIMGTVMYWVEGEEHGFVSIPHGIYWAVVTLTTVGYGDIAPATLAGRTIAALVMVTGYSIIAVPTGIVTAELTQVQRTGGTPGPRARAVATRRRTSTRATAAPAPVFY